MLSIMIAISALCISLIPSVNQNVYAADLADSIDVSTGKLPGVVGGSGKWEGIAVKSGNVIALVLGSLLHCAGGIRTLMASCWQSA